jgi:circadian clock protein KaiB
MSQRARFRARLYVAGDAQNSVAATANLAAFCRGRLQNQCDIEIVDVFREPKRALAAGVFMTPTLISLKPHANRRIVGILSDPQQVVDALGLEFLVS